MPRPHVSLPRGIERPCCETCRRLLRPWTSFADHDTPDDGPKLGQSWQEPGARYPYSIKAVSRVHHREHLTYRAYVTAFWDGTFKGYPKRDPKFCTIDCMLNFAMAAYRAGYRITGE